MQKRLFSLLLCLACSFALAADRSDTLIANFEGESYGSWSVTGEAFGARPAQGTLPGQMAVTGYLGHGLVNSFYKGDDTTGTLTSSTFLITRKYINFLIGGGKFPGLTCINLLVDGSVVRTATGPNDKPGGTERLNWYSWDVANLQGKQARIEIVDKAKNGWGHINVDEIAQSDGKRMEGIRADVIYRETYRPQFHFTSRTNWLNDPNGLVFYKGEYHLFFQHNPSGIDWGNMTWGHAVSRDLVHWEQLPNALEPDRLGTMFSGSAIVDWDNTAGFQMGKEKTLVAIYTAAGGTSDASKGQPFTQCIAYSSDKGRTWTKYAQNPVLAHIVAENRDPKVIWHASTKQWIMVLYLDKEEYGFFASPDLKHWTHLHDITVPGCTECPDLFELGVEGSPTTKKWVLTGANGHYLVGTFDGRHFTPEGEPHPADYGANYYAVQSYSDIPASDGRRIQVAWMSGGSYPQMPFNQQMSFPCELTLRHTDEGLRLYRYPIREITSLVSPSKERKWQEIDLRASSLPLKGVSGELWDIEAEFEIEDATEFGLNVRGETISYDVHANTLTCLGRSAPLKPEGGHIRIRILADATTLETFGNGGRAVLTSCFLPRQKEKSIAVFANNGSVRVVSLRVSPLRSAWKSGAK